MNAYVRIRACEKCGKTFKTYELGELSFKAMRKCIEMSSALGKVINSTWATTRNEFINQRVKALKQRENVQKALSASEIQFEADMKKEPSYLGDNIVSIFKNKDTDDDRS